MPGVKLGMLFALVFLLLQTSHLVRDANSHKKQEGCFSRNWAQSLQGWLKHFDTLTWFIVIAVPHINLTTSVCCLSVPVLVPLKYPFLVLHDIYLSVSPPWTTSCLQHSPSLSLEVSGWSRSLVRSFLRWWSMAAFFPSLVGPRKSPVQGQSLLHNRCFMNSYMYFKGIKVITLSEQNILITIQSIPAPNTINIWPVNEQIFEVKCQWHGLLLDKPLCWFVYLVLPSPSPPFSAAFRNLARSCLCLPSLPLFLAASTAVDREGAETERERP